MSVSRFAGQAVRDFRGISLPTITDFMPGKEDYGQTVSQGIAERGATEATSLTAQAREIAASIGAKRADEKAKHVAAYERAAGRTRGSTNEFLGAMSGLEGVVGGAIKGGYFNGSSSSNFDLNPLGGLSFSEPVI